jgi:hypothetical protein
MCDRDPGADNQLQFKFEHCDPDHVSIMGVASGCYLHGRDADPSDEMERNWVMMSPLPPRGEPSLNWRICENKNGTVSFVCKSNGCYLDGRHGPGEILWITKRDFDPIFNPYFEWRMEQLA